MPNYHPEERSFFYGDVMENSDSTAVYKHINEEGEVIYVGITNNIPSRTGVHSRNSYWFEQVERIEIEWCPTREQAFSLEELEIKKHRPKYNVVHNAPVEIEGQPYEGLVRSYDLSYRDVEAILALYATRSHKGASDVLCVTQPTFSIRMKKIQESLGFIISRVDTSVRRRTDNGGKGGVIFTRRGEALVEGCKIISSAHDLAIDKINSAKTRRYLA